MPVHLNDAENRSDRAGVRDRSGSRAARAINFVRDHGLSAVWKLARENGWSGSAHFVHRNIRYLLSARFDAAFDARHGVDTSGDVPAGYVETDSPNAALGHQFRSTSTRSFNAVMKMLPVDIRQFTFVDVGSGKGRTLLLAATFPLRHVLGIEYAPNLVEIAKANVRNYQGPPELRCKSIESICADATAVTYPRTPLIIYFFNPFEIEIFARVLSRIVDSYKQSPRPILLIYTSGVEDVLTAVADLVVGSEVFEQRRAEALPFFLDAPWRLRCRVFATKEVA